MSVFVGFSAGRWGPPTGGSRRLLASWPTIWPHRLVVLLVAGYCSLTSRLISLMMHILRGSEVAGYWEPATPQADWGAWPPSSVSLAEGARRPRAVLTACRGWRHGQHGNSAAPDGGWPTRTAHCGHAPSLNSTSSSRTISPPMRCCCCPPSSVSLAEVARRPRAVLTACRGWRHGQHGNSAAPDGGWPTRTAHCGHACSGIRGWQALL